MSHDPTAQNPPSKPLDCDESSSQLDAASIAEKSDVQTSTSTEAKKVREPRYVQADPVYRAAMQAQKGRRENIKLRNPGGGLVVTDLLKLRIALDKAPSLEKACQVLAENLCNLFECSNVLVSLKLKNSLKILGYDCESSFDFDETTILSAQREVSEKLPCAGWPAKEQWESSLVHKELVSEHYPTATSFSMNLEGSCLGVITVVGDTTTCVALTEKINHIVDLVAPHLKLRQQAAQSILDRVRKSVAPRVKSSLKWGIAACILLTLFFVRMPHRIQCDTEAKPIVRRFVSAPFDSVLKTSVVRSGDQISMDQTLAFLDEDEIRLQMSSAEAEKEKYRKLKSTALAKGDTVAMQQAQLEFRRLSYRNDLLQQRSSNLEITSPISGIVLRNELEDAEGAPLTQGQVLFEIAPLDRMFFCVYVSQQDISYVDEGMTVKVAMDGTQQTLEGKIRRIRPQAVTFENESVFVAEVEFENANELVRPGMRGYATVVSKNQSIGWILFRKPLAYLKKLTGF